eukprot:969716-Pelagomonas_calceolata.AAC.5
MSIKLPELQVPSQDYKQEDLDVRYKEELRKLQGEIWFETKASIARIMPAWLCESRGTSAIRPYILLPGPFIHYLLHCIFCKFSYKREVMPLQHIPYHPRTLLA